MKTLTAKQRAFAGLIVDGLNGSEAYRRTYSPNGKATVIAVKACELRRRPEVADLIARLQAKTETRETLSRQHKREILAELVLNAEEGGPTIDQKLKAIELDNKMAGHNQPEQLKLTGRDGPRVEGRPTEPVLSDAVKQVAVILAVRRPCNGSGGAISPGRQAGWDCGIGRGDLQSPPPSPRS